MTVSAAVIGMTDSLPHMGVGKLPAAPNTWQHQCPFWTGRTDLYSRLPFPPFAMSIYQHDYIPLLLIQVLNFWMHLKKPFVVKLCSGICIESMTHSYSKRLWFALISINERELLCILLLDIAIFAIKINCVTWKLDCLAQALLHKPCHFSKNELLTEDLGVLFITSVLRNGNYLYT